MITNQMYRTTLFFVLFCFFSLDKNDNRPQVFMQLTPLLKHTFALCPVNLRKKKDAEWSAFTIHLQPLCLHCFILGNTLHLFLVPHLFKIDASLQNSLSLQCTSLYV